MSKQLQGIFILLMSSIVPIWCDQSHEHATADEWINIYVHGSVGSSMRMKYFFTLFKKDVSKTSYYTQTCEHRNDPQWTKNHAAQGLGMQKIDPFSKHKTAAQLFAHLYDAVQHKFYPNQTCIDSYTYGWSGAVNHKKRCEDATIFYKELKELVLLKRESNLQVKVRIIAYSHGGNVVLNMAQEHNNDEHPNDFVINELILIATPVQQETDCYALHPFFERIYSICSRADCIQRADCFSTAGFFSGRSFCDNSRCPCSKAVQHIELKVTMAANKDLKNNLTTSSKKRIDRSPGHIELWYFSDLCEYCCNGVRGMYQPCFESKMYRPYFPLEPLPAALLAPGLVAALQNYSPNCGSIVVEVQPDTGKAIVREKHTSNKTTINFFSPQELDKLRDIAFPHLNKHRLEEY